MHSSGWMITSHILALAICNATATSVVSAPCVADVAPSGLVAAVARQMLLDQLARIARLKASGTDTSLAEETLLALEANLRRFQSHRDWSE
jgi:hypothetical protein